MSISPMEDAVAETLASVSDYNVHKANILDLDTRVTSNTGIITHGTSGNAALGTRVTALEAGPLSLKRAIYPQQSTNLLGPLAASAEGTLTLFTTTFTVQNNYYYRFNLGLMPYSTVANDIASVRLRLNSAAGTIVDTCQSVLPVSNSVDSHYMSMVWLSTTSGSQTFAFTVLASSGNTGSVSVYQDANNKNTMEAFEIAPPGTGVVIVS